MYLLNRETDYALRSLIFIAKNDQKTVSVKDITEKIGLPKALTRKSLQKLAKEKILVSQKGKDGGFLLARRPDEITLKQILEIFQGSFSLGECIFKKKICPERKNCMLRKKILKIENIVESELEGITLGSLLKGE